MDLVLTVAKELHERAFPELLPLDRTALQEALFGFIYGPGDKTHHNADYGRTGPSAIDESRPGATHPSILDDPTRTGADPLRRFERLQVAPWDEHDQPVAPWDDATGFAPVVDHLADMAQRTDQPPACPRHDWNDLGCPPCGDLRRAFYIELGRRMAETADEVGPCAGGRCIDPAAHAEGAHDL